MDVKQAVGLAKSYVQELFAEEQIANLGLEEVEFDPQHRLWQVTIGFTRPWDVPQDAFSAIALANRPGRSFKIVSIDDNDPRVLSVKDRAH